MNLSALLALATTGDDVFSWAGHDAARLPLFGGQLLAQGLMAALLAIDADRPAHSLHAHFLRAGHGGDAIGFAVRRTRDGRSFSTRQVTARQAGRSLMRATISCQAAEDGLAFQPVMPDVPPPEALPSESEIRREAMDRGGVAWTASLDTDLLPVDLRPVTPRDYVAPRVMPPAQHFWVRLHEPPANDWRRQQAAIAFLSDMMLLSTALLPHGVFWATTPMDRASLDHALWLHAVPSFDDWLLWSLETSWSGGGRGLAQGRFFQRDGRLVASVAQEGLIRIRQATQAG